MSEEQMRSYIIDKDSYDKNILVEAGAGAGKTRLIIQRVIGQIGAGIPVEKIVLITFTNAAANELYERIQAGLTENIAKCSGEEKKLYENAVMNLQRMKISTIHSFCLSMLSEQPFEADLHLGLKLAEDVHLPLKMQSESNGPNASPEEKHCQQKNTQHQPVLIMLLHHCRSIFSEFPYFCENRLFPHRTIPCRYFYLLFPDIHNILCDTAFPLCHESVLRKCTERSPVVYIIKMNSSEHRPWTARK